MQSVKLNGFNLQVRKYINNDWRLREGDIVETVDGVKYTLKQETAKNTQGTINGGYRQPNFCIVERVYSTDVHGAEVHVELDTFFQKETIKLYIK